MSVLTRATWRNIPEDAILHNHRCENLKSYICTHCWKKKQTGRMCGPGLKQRRGKGNASFLKAAAGIKPLQIHFAGVRSTSAYSKQFSHGLRGHKTARDGRMRLRRGGAVKDGFQGVYYLLGRYVRRIIETWPRRNEEWGGVVTRIILV
jgi:hypothetical protein